MSVLLSMLLGNNIILILGLWIHIKIKPENQSKDL